MTSIIYDRVMFFFRLYVYTEYGSFSLKIRSISFIPLIDRESAHLQFSSEQEAKVRNTNENVFNGRYKFGEESRRINIYETLLSRDRNSRILNETTNIISRMQSEQTIKIFYDNWESEQEKRRKLVYTSCKNKSGMLHPTIHNLAMKRL